jgi:DNA-binding transcriptional MerR regulator
MASQLSRKHALDSPSIPDRLYFKIGDVARICGLETYVLRFWETQFPQLKPNKSGTGQRLYRRRDVELALEIKRLVHQEGFTIAGARQTLEHSGRRHQPEAMQPAPMLVPEPQAAQHTPDSVAATIGHARAELREIASLLANPVSKQPRRRARVTTMPISGSLFPA